VKLWQASSALDLVYHALGLSQGRRTSIAYPVNQCGALLCVLLGAMVLPVSTFHWGTLGLYLRMVILSEALIV
jgi:hypothetical protein